MRILQILNAPLDSGSRVSHIEQLSYGLRSIGHEVMVVAGKGESQSALAENGIEFRPLRATGWFGRWRETAQYAREWNAEILHAHDPESARACLMTSFPVVGTYHSVCSDAYRKGILSKSLSHLIAVSEAARGELVKLGGLQPSQIPVIPECLDLDGYARGIRNRGVVSTQDVADTLPQMGKTFHILYVPHTEQLDEVSQVLEGSHLASERGQLHRLVVVGLPSTCRSLLAQQKLINREVGYPLVNVVEDTSLYAWLLARVDAVMGMGRTLIEGLAMEKPVVSLHGGELGGIVRTGHIFGWEQSGFTSEQTRSSSLIADDVCHLLKNVPSLPAHVASVRELLSQVVNVAHVATRTMVVYQACIEVQGSRGWLRHALRRIGLALR